MRIGMVASSYPRFPGDIAGVFVRSLADDVADLGHHVHVMAPYDPIAVPVADGKVSVTRFAYLPVKGLHQMGYGKNLENDRTLRLNSYALAPFYLVGGFMALLKLVLGTSFQVIHAHWVVPNGPICAWVSKITGVPLVITLHGSDIYVVERLAAARPVAAAAFRQAALITTCSPDLAERAVKLGASEAKLRVIPWGVDEALFKNRSGLKWRQKLGISPDQRVVLAVGRLVAKKGMEYLVKAIPYLVDLFPKAAFVIGGDGPLLPYLGKLAEDMGVKDKVCFPGVIPWNEMPDFLAMGDVFVAPSVKDEGGNVDGLPTVILEAMASALPIVTTPVGGIPLVMSNGENGLLTEAKDPQKLAEAIAFYLGSPEASEKAGRASRCRVERELTWNNIARAYVSVYEEAWASRI